jgi:recombination protein RecT
MTDTETNVPAPANGVPARMSPMQELRTNITKMDKEFACALPPQIPVQKFIRTTITALQMNPDIVDCDRRTVFAACMKAAQDGLLLDGREAALVKYGTSAQYMPMIGGLLKKLRNSGLLASISAHVAHEHDQFVYELGDEERIVHKPAMGDRGKPIAAYAIAKMKDGAIYRDVMSVDEVEKVRSVSKAKNSGPWTQWWGEMARKTVLRRLLKRMPSSADIDAVIESDNEHTDLNPQVATDAPTMTAPTRLRQSIGIETPEETPREPCSDDA